MNTSEVGISLIKRFEGFRSSPYRCPNDVPTIGYGTTIYPDGRPVRLCDADIKEKEAVVFLKSDVSRFEAQVSKLVTSQLSQNQFDALVSFAYNLGGGALKRSTLLKKVNINPCDPSIRTEFEKWVNAGGKKLKGLVLRREAEAELYFSHAPTS